MTHDVTVVVAAHDAAWRAELTTAIEDAEGLSLLAVCQDGDEVLTAVRSHRPAVAVLDEEMGGTDGGQIAQALHDERLPTRVVLLSEASAAADAAARVVRKDDDIAAALPGLLREVAEEAGGA